MMMLKREEYEASIKELVKAHNSPDQELGRDTVPLTVGIMLIQLLLDIRDQLRSID